MGGSKGSWDQDFIGPAITEAVGPIAHLEQEWDQPKLEKRMRSYFKNGAKGLEFWSTPWSALVEEYADRVFSSIFQALSDRVWVGQVDFLLVLDAGIKEMFPQNLLKNVPQEVFEAAVLNAHDRAFEEQRYAPLLWETIGRSFAGEGPKMKKRLYEAFEEGRKDAAHVNAPPESNQVEAFIHSWVTGSVTRMRRDCGDELEVTLPVDDCVTFVDELIAGGALPLGLVAESEPPPAGSPVVANAVQNAYTLPAHVNKVAQNAYPRGASQARALGYGQAPVPEPQPRHEFKGWGGQDGSWGGKGGCKGGGKGDFGTVKGGGGGFSVGNGGGKMWAQGQKRAADSWDSDPAGPAGAPAVKRWKGAAVQKAPKQLVPTQKSGQRGLAPTARAVPTAPAAGKGGPKNVKKGHYLCTQQEDCIGSTNSLVVQHMDNDVPGDIYCIECWGVFSSADPSLQAIPYEPGLS